MTVRIGYALAMAAATGAPIQVADPLMDQLAVPAQDDPVGQFTRDVPLPRPRRAWSAGARWSASRLADQHLTAAWAAGTA
jgi:hypothetical protein